MPFTGGKLKLKGGDVGKKKSKKKKVSEGGEGALIVVEGAAGSAAVVQEVCLLRHLTYPVPRADAEVAALLGALNLCSGRQGMQTCYQPRPPLSSWTGLFPGTC